MSCHEETVRKPCENKSKIESNFFEHFQEIRSQIDEHRERLKKNIDDIATEMIDET